MTISGIGGGIKSFVLFIIIEFVLITFGLVVMGGFGFEPLPLIIAICDDLSITTGDLSVGIFIIGTFFNLILMFVSVYRS